MVAQCFEYRNIPEPPRLPQALNAVERLCSKIDSSDCKDCVRASNSGTSDLSSSCKYVYVWAKLCGNPAAKNLHECISLAQQCSIYKGYYGEVSTDICSMNQAIFIHDDSIPPETEAMFSKSYFYFSTTGPFLLKSWFVRTKLQLIFSIISCLAIGALSSKVLRSSVGRSEYIHLGAGYSSNYDNCDSIEQCYPPWGMMVVEKIISLFNKDVKAPLTTVKILGEFVEFLVSIPLVSLVIMIISSGNLLWIIFSAVGFCVSSLFSRTANKYT